MMKKYCRVEGCEGEVRARGYCGTHSTLLQEKPKDSLRVQVGICLTN